MKFITTYFTFLMSSTIIFLTATSWNTVIHDEHDEYPLRSLACKMFKETLLDCSRRELNTVPPIGKHNATSVDLSNNEIELISQMAFVGQIQLTSIDFTANQLKNITGSPFAGLASLVVLVLSKNELSHLASTAFRGLHNLEVLDVSHNILKSVPDAVFRDLLNLKILQLTFNELTAVPNAALSPLHKLEELHLAYCHFTSATFGPEFESLTNLNKLSFATTKNITITNSTFQHFTRSPLRELLLMWFPYNLEVGIFKTLENIEFLVTPGPFCFRATESLFLLPSSVKRIELQVGCPIISRNFLMPLSNLNETLTSLYFTTALKTPDIKIERFAFEWFPFLRELKLSDFQHGWIHSDEVFFGLNQLETLSLIRMMLTSIPSEAFLAFANTQSLKRLDLSENSLTGNFLPDAFASVTSLESLDLSYNPIAFITEWIERLTNLTSIFLNGEGIQSISRVSWNRPLYYLKEIRLDGLVAWPPEYNELILSHTAPNIEILTVADAKYKGILLAIRNLTSLQHLDVSGSLTVLTEDNLFKQWSTTLFSNLKSLKFARNSLKTMTNLNLNITTPRVVDVDLSTNAITVVDKTLGLLLYLQHLNLNGNQISSLDNFQNLVHMKSLKLAQNLINYVPVTFVKTLTESELEFLDMSNNPFECTCAIKPFQDWILGDKRIYLEPGIYRCDGPSESKGISLTQVNLDCSTYLGLHIGIAAVCIVLAGLATTLSWRYRWHLRYRIFLLCKWLRMRYDDVDVVDRDNNRNDFEMVELRYDAFVSYAHESDNDLEWVLNEMRPNLEEGPEPIRLCIGQARDFLPGTNLFDSISDAIHQSRKTIVVLSPSYVNSELCYFETQHAWKRLLEEGRDVLILILLEPIPDDKMTIWMRQLLCKKGYLRWPHGRAGHQLFWRCVREKIKQRTLVIRRFDA